MEKEARLQAEKLLVDCQVQNNKLKERIQKADARTRKYTQMLYESKQQHKIIADKQTTIN